MQQGMYEGMRNIHKDVNDKARGIQDDTKNILVRQSTSVMRSVLITQTSDRMLRTLIFWQSWNLCAMLGTRPVIMTSASLGLESQSSRIS